MSQFHNHAQSLKVKNSGGPLDNQTWHTDNWPQRKLDKYQWLLFYYLPLPIYCLDYVRKGLWEGGGIEFVFHIRGVFVWVYSGIGIVGTSQIIVRSRATLIPEWL